MPVRPSLLLSILLAASAAVAADAPAAVDALPRECGAFAWDVSNELAVLQSPSTAGVAGMGGDADAVRIELDTRYDMRLHPQGAVTLAARPAKAPADDAVAGLLVFQVPVDGRYRVSLDTAHWVDVVDGGEIVASTGHEGRHGCPLLRKVVEFDLAAGRDLVLQVLGGAGSETSVLITAAGGQ
ncbi:hypothetical protein [Luteimonas arsenica]|uniref:hypothetical protein n=1 Tax=Luteimonas arsenica TaxID=1586242 RepID=UPI0010555BCC|nr:hypothetical protein [Luteimonas arsenica]